MDRKRLGSAAVAVAILCALVSALAPVDTPTASAFSADYQLGDFIDGDPGRDSRTRDLADPDAPRGIVGGTPTTFDEHPYFVTVGFFLQEGCGGSMIDPVWVLTAAHCVDGDFVYWVGAADGQRQVAEVILHPQWNGDTADGWDLALLRLPSGLADGQQIVQVGSPFRQNAYEAGRTVEMVGRGRTGPDEPVGMLHDVSMSIRPDAEMVLLFGPLPWKSLFDPEDMIGAGTSTRTICHGDSGGPLTTAVSGKRVQIGVASFGPSDCDGAAVYAEMDNANLAWVATEVPAVRNNWAQCVAGGRAGTPLVRYEPGNAGPHRDGAYSWNLTCVADSPPPPRPVPTDPPICDINPRKCELDPKPSR